LHGELYARLCKKALSFPPPDPGASLGIDAFTAGDQMGVGVCVNGAAPTGHPPCDRAALFGGVSHRGALGFLHGDTDVDGQTGQKGWSGIREQQMGGSGGSLEPPGPLLMHLHTVYMAYSERLPTRLTPWLRGIISPCLFCV